jgi:hypothetical protein
MAKAVFYFFGLQGAETMFLNLTAATASDLSTILRFLWCAC